MCGIVGAVSERNVVPVLIEGLKRLEYRGYDSCGVAVVQRDVLQRTRSTSRVLELEKTCDANDVQGSIGIAHTRWATHGAPSTDNAHPHFSYGPTNGRQARIAVVHNGIVENHELLRAELRDLGYHFDSQTDTEVIAHLIDSLYTDDLLMAVQAATARLHGAFAIAVISHKEPSRMIGARQGSPLVLGVCSDASPHGQYLASDALALVVGVTDQIVYLEDGDVVDVRLQGAQVYARTGMAFERVDRPVQTVQPSAFMAELGSYRHFMQKEIFEQPRAIADTLHGAGTVSPALFGGAEHLDVDQVLILACGTSFYSGSVARYWFESVAKIPCSVEIASEYRYRDSVPNPRTLVIAISQSGETADTLAAVRHARSLGMERTLAICNVPTSAMVRECQHAFITRAGIEIGVASTKAFTTQLVGLFLLTLTLAKLRGHLNEEQEATHLKALHHLPTAAQGVLALEPQLVAWAQQFTRKENALFLGRGMHFPIALEGALKLKEITYIHAEAYAAGELKHGPLALVTSEMPVVVVAPNDALLEKLKSNMQEVRARGGELFVLADAYTRIEPGEGMHVIRMPDHYGVLSPLLHVLPLQLLAYHTACLKGTDVDRPRCLAKAVTTE